MRHLLALLLLTSSPWSSILILAQFFQDPLTLIGETIVGENLLGSHFGNIDINQTFDYLIVGGGTAGLVIARRLAENKNSTIAVIEAGGLYEFDNGNFSQIPAQAGQYVTTLAKNPLIDWYQYTVPQVGLNGRSLFYPQGKTFGGGSSRNNLLYQRSSRGSYDTWAEQVGDESYKFVRLLPYFRRSPHFTLPSSYYRPQNSTPRYNTSAFDPSGGPLQVSYPRYVNPSSSWIAKGFSAAGLPQVDGFSDGSLLGWSYFTHSLNPSTQTRSSSYSSFMKEALAKTSNVQFYKTTLAKKIVFDERKVAHSVLVETAGVQYYLSSRKEIITSAGSFRSPQLLMVSGVGPASTLESFGIPVIADRPGVGQNMKDNIFSGCTYPTGLTTHGSLSNPSFLNDAITEYNTNRTGIMTNSGGDLIAFERLLNLSMNTQADLDNTFGTDWPHVEYIPLDGFFGDTASMPNPNSNYIGLLAGITAPFSSGNVTIKSSDTAENPVINPNWLTDPRDQEILIAGFRRTRQILGSTQLSPILTGQEAFPGKNSTSDDEILESIKQSAITIWHASGTNKMGREDDPMAVVNSRGSVLGGVQGLRVVDASIMPFLPPGHPQGNVYMLAEKIAEDILQDRT